MVFLQALVSKRGPAFRCFTEVERGRVILALSPSVFAEVREVLGRFDLQQKFTGLIPERVDRFLKEVASRSIFLQDVPSIFNLPRDPKDEPYIDLAIAAHANYLVTWNMRHLGYLMKHDTPEGKDFCRRFPDIKILEPPTFLHDVDGLPDKPGTV